VKLAAKLIVPALLALAIASPSGAIPAAGLGVARPAESPSILGCFSNASPKFTSCFEAHKVTGGIHVYYVEARWKGILGLASENIVEDVVVQGDLSSVPHLGALPDVRLDVTLPVSGALHIFAVADHFTNGIINQYVAYPFVVAGIVPNNIRQMSTANADATGTIRGLPVTSSDTIYGLTRSTLFWQVASE
jgi:hypothetical protein